MPNIFQEIREKEKIFPYLHSKTSPRQNVLHRKATACLKQNYRPFNKKKKATSFIGMAFF